MFVPNSHEYLSNLWPIKTRKFWPRGWDIDRDATYLNLSCCLHLDCSAFKERNSPIVSEDEIIHRFLTLILDSNELQMRGKKSPKFRNYSILLNMGDFLIWCRQRNFYQKCRKRYWKKGPIGCSWFHASFWTILHILQILFSENDQKFSLNSVEEFSFDNKNKTIDNPKKRSKKWWYIKCLNLEK